MALPSTAFDRVLCAGIRANVPTLLWGAPGQGKTARLDRLGKAMGRRVETLIGSTREATDFLGIMVENEGVVSYSSFGWVQRLNKAKGGLLFLDELTTAAPSVMKGMLRVVQERFVGEDQLKGSVSIVAAANPPETAVDGYDLPAPMANRFMHLDWVFDTEEWMDGIVSGFEHAPAPDLSRMLSADPETRRIAVAGQVAGFLSGRNELLVPAVPEDAVAAGRAWASPRSWTNLIEVVSHLRADDMAGIMMAAKGLVGEGPGHEFATWLVQNDLYDPAEVLADPSIVDWDSRPDKLYALAQSVAGLGLARADNWLPAVKVMTAFAVNGRPDIALAGSTKLVNAKPAGEKFPMSFRDAFTELFARTQHRVVAAA